MPVEFPYYDNSMPQTPLPPIEHRVRRMFLAYFFAVCAITAFVVLVTR